MPLVINGAPVEHRSGDDVLVAAVRAGLTPGGALCGTGDCPNCLAVVDGVAYTRMCRTPARPGMVVTLQPADQPPDLPTGPGRAEPAPAGRHPGSQLVEVDVAVVGGGPTGRAEAEALRAAGRQVLVVDDGAGADVVGVYEGPELIVRTPEGMLRVEAAEVVVATGAAEIQPACPGNRLAGIVTPRGLARLAAAGVDLGRVVAVGPPPTVPGIDVQPVAGTLVRFEPADLYPDPAPDRAASGAAPAASGAAPPGGPPAPGADPPGDGREPGVGRAGTPARVGAVVVRGADGAEHRHPCDTVCVNLGWSPRNLLLGMGDGWAVRAVGRAGQEGQLPPEPTEGIVCPCTGATVADLHGVFDRGFQELELVKRASLCGTGTCQGAACMPHVRAFLAARAVPTTGSFTPRPLVRQVTMAEAAAGWYPPPVRRTLLHAEHRALGARMDRFGGWWRPWRYGDPTREYWAVREGVSLGDVGTLGRFLLSGPDSATLVDRLYAGRTADLAPGRSRYGLLLAESGAVLDDGMVCRLDEHRWLLTVTSGGANLIEAWIRDWAATFATRVHLLDRTHAWGAVNVTGPLAGELLARAGFDGPLPYLAHTRAAVAGVPCQVLRLGFTGEVSYELHHRADRSVELWRALLRLGRSLGVAPHGLDTLLTLRLEKGHVIVGMDTEADSTPRRLGLEWAVAAGKGEFVGRAALERTAPIPVERKLLGLTAAGPPPDEGSILWAGGAYAGYVSSARFSPALGHTVMLAWVLVDDAGQPPAELTVADRPALVSPLPFYDPEGRRVRA